MPIIDENTKYKFLILVNGKEMFAMVKEMPMHNQFELHFPMNVSLSAAATGGVLVNLGPTNPFSKEDHITIDKDSILFMNELDKICVKLKIIPSIIKDSRLSKKIVEQCYPEYSKFRDLINTYDKKRIYKSEISQRLEIWNI